MCIFRNHLTLNYHIENEKIYFTKNEKNKLILRFEDETLMYHLCLLLRSNILCTNNKFIPELGIILLNFNFMRGIDIFFAFPILFYNHQTTISN